MISFLSGVLGVSASTVYAIFGTLCLLLIDWGLGIAVAVFKNHNFDPAKLPQQWATQILGYVGGLSLAGVLQAFTAGGLKTALLSVIIAGAAAVSSKVVLDIAVKFTALVTSTPPAGVLLVTNYSVPFHKTTPRPAPAALDRAT